MRSILKNTALIGFTALITLSCQNEVKENNTATGTDSLSQDVTEQPVIMNEYELLWSYDAELDSMVKKEGVAPSDADQIIQAINKKYAQIAVLDYVKTSSDTVYVKIADATQLNSQMGTAGAHEYLSEITYSLTDIPTINFVNFDFEEGDHATPGVYEKESFNNKVR